MAHAWKNQLLVSFYVIGIDFSITPWEVNVYVVFSKYHKVRKYMYVLCGKYALKICVCLYVNVIDLPHQYRYWIDSSASRIKPISEGNLQ